MTTIPVIRIYAISCLNDGKLNAVFKMIDRKFIKLMSPHRIELIKRCLDIRVQMLKEAVKLMIKKILSLFKQEGNEDLLCQRMSM